MVDASHANSSKKPENQPLVTADIAGQISGGENRIMGVMIESNLVAGRQDVVPGKPLTYGQSITDGCIDWATTATALEQLADAVEIRRNAEARRAARALRVSRGNRRAGRCCSRPARRRSCGLAAAADALDLLVERRVFLVHGIVRIAQILLARHVAGARLAMTDGRLRQRSRCGAA